MYREQPVRPVRDVKQWFTDRTVGKLHMISGTKSKLNTKKKGSGKIRNDCLVESYKKFLVQLTDEEVHLGFTCLRLRGCHYQDSATE